MIEDGATNWGKGGPKPVAEGFDIKVRQQAIYDWVRQVRGGVLGGAFTIERHMSAAIVYFMLGDRVRRGEVQAAFDEGLLTPLTFERRINVVLLIARHFMTEGKLKDPEGRSQRPADHSQFDGSPTVLVPSRTEREGRTV